jgi:hypothetical protein
MNRKRMTRSGLRGGLGILAALAGLGHAAPAMGQGQGTSCVEQSLPCAASGLDSGSNRCAEFTSCFVTASESVYYLADGRRFDCDGLNCTRAQSELNAFCCPRVDSDAGAGRGRVPHGDGCTLSSLTSSSDTAVTTGGLLLLSLLTVRRRRLR